MRDNLKGVDKKPRVSLIAYTCNPKTKYGPQSAVVAGALGCFEERASKELLTGLLRLEEEERLKKEERIIKETVARGHGSVSDQASFTFSIENLPRATTLFLCGPQYLSHEQQSLRRATASRRFFLPESIRDRKTIELLDDSFKVYSELDAMGIPKEDARFPLPLATRTNIQTTGDVRELTHILAMAGDEYVPEITRQTAKRMITQAKQRAPALFEDYKFNTDPITFFPSAHLFGKTNQSLERLIAKHKGKGASMISYSQVEQFDRETFEKAVRERDWAELSNLKHQHYTLLVPMSIISFHQATRQRTWDQAVQSVYDAEKEFEYITPPLVAEKPGAEKIYSEITQRMHGRYQELVTKGVHPKDAVLVLPHNMQVYDLMHLNAWNAIYAIGLRTCKTAQWEIRQLSDAMAKQINKVNPQLGEYAVPRGKLFGQCPEREKCGYCFRKD